MERKFFYFLFSFKILKLNFYTRILETMENFHLTKLYKLNCVANILKSVFGDSFVVSVQKEKYFQSRKIKKK